MFNINLKNIMDQRGVTAAELSKITGIGKSNFSNWRHATSKPGVKTMQVLAEALDCTIEDLTGSTPEAQVIEAQTPLSAPIVGIKNVSIEEAARRMGKSKQFVRVALQKGVAPFGFAIKVSGNKYSYNIPPARLERYLSGL